METYYKPEDLPKFEEIGKEAPELAKKFFEYYAAVFAEGELTEREKALIALAVAHTVQSGLSGKRFQPGGDDRGGSRRYSYPGRIITCAWNSNAQYCTKIVPVKTNNRYLPIGL